MEFRKSAFIQALSHENEPNCHILRQFVRDPAILNDTYIVGKALSFAVKNSFLNSVRILLEAGVSPNIRSGYHGETALHPACERQCTEIILELLKYGANVNAEDLHNKRTPLHKASLNRHIENMQILLQNGAMVNAVDVNRITPLHLAIGFPRYERSVISVIHVLLRAGADVNVSNVDGMTPLHYAVVHQSPQAVRLLLRYKADANVRNNWGNTSLHCTSEVNDAYEIIMELVKGGARLNSLNYEGHSPLYCAIENSLNVEATQALLRYGASFDIDACLKSLKKSAIKKLRPLYKITEITCQLIRYVFIHNPHSLERIHQQLMQEKVSNILLNISSPKCNLNKLQQTCFTEAKALSKLNCDCGKSSIWGSINKCEDCKCDTHQAILKFLFSSRHTNFTDAFFYKLDQNFLLEVTLTLISYFAFKESKKRLILPWPCMKEIERYVSFEDAVSFLQYKQSQMVTSEFEKFRAFMKGESTVESSSEISTPKFQRLQVS